MDKLDDIYFDNITRENVKKFYKAKSKIRKIIHAYQVALTRLGKSEEFSTVREFEKHKFLETNSIN